MAQDTRYARNGDVHIAYQVVGDGPIDVVLVTGFTSHVELAWEFPAWAHTFRRISSFARLIMFDKRGTGLSDRARLPTLEERMDDVRAVMDAAGSERAAVWGQSEGGAMSILFAATHPERTSALVLQGAFAHPLADDDQPWGVPADLFDDFLGRIERLWGSGAMTVAFSRDADLGRVRAHMSRYERYSASPGAAIELMRTNAQIDVRHVLPAIRVPTLVLHATGDRLVPVEHGRHLAGAIPGARYVEIPRDEHIVSDEKGADAVVDEIEEFLTGVRRAPAPDRVLATVLFTDIVSSTERAAEHGDAEWRALLDGHDRTARTAIDRHRGTLVKSTGDGILATFDGPARAIRCALDLTSAMRSLGLEIRSGLHTGEIELRGDDVGGLAVHIGARVAALAGAGEVLASRTVKDLVAGSGLVFDGRGTHTLKGVPDEWQLYAVSA